MFAQLSLQNIADNDGLGIALTGMLIVFSALLMITCSIIALPRVLVAVAGYLPEEHAHHAAAPPQPTELSEADEAVAVAIGYALHKALQKRLRQSKS
jgi:Na+-transporting methylmalonyl-CoA/oxaloacetate decarboxylase gamma subunit